MSRFYAGIRKMRKSTAAAALSGAAFDLFYGPPLTPEILREIGELVRIFNKTLENLASSLGDEKEARRLLLGSYPEDLRHVFEALLKRRPGRPLRDGGRTARKDAALLAIYAWKKSKNPRMNDRDFARIVLKLEGKKKAVNSDAADAEIRAIAKRLRDARKRANNLN
jgi:hypothetical protein